MVPLLPWFGQRIMPTYIEMSHWTPGKNSQLLSIKIKLFKGEGTKISKAFLLNYLLHCHFGLSLFHAFGGSVDRWIHNWHTFQLGQPSRLDVPQSLLFVWKSVANLPVWLLQLSSYLPPGWWLQLHINLCAQSTPSQQHRAPYISQSSPTTWAILFFLDCLIHEHLWIQLKPDSRMLACLFCVVFLEKLPQRSNLYVGGICSWISESLYLLSFAKHIVWSIYTLLSSSSEPWAFW